MTKGLSSGGGLKETGTFKGFTGIGGFLESVEAPAPAAKKLYILPKEFHPDFQNPRKKPIGPVEIDSTNPLSSDLIGFWLMRNLVEENYKTGLVTTPSTIKPKITQPLGIKFNNSTSSTTATEWIDTHITESPVDTLSLAFEVRINTPDSEYPGNYEEVMTKGTTFSSSTDFAFSLHRDGDTNNSRRLAFYARTAGGDLSGAESAQASLLLEVGQTRIVGVTFNNGSIQFFIDGKASGSPFTGKFISDRGGIFRTLRIGAGTGQSSTSRGCAETINWAFASNKALSIMEMENFLADPYQILKPKTPSVYFTLGAIIAGWTGTINGVTNTPRINGILMTGINEVPST